MTQRSFPVFLAGNQRRLVAEIRFANNADADVLLSLGAELRFDGVYRVEEGEGLALQALSVGPAIEEKGETYYVLIQPWAVYVKAGDFFKAQGGLVKDWGKHWEPVHATGIEHARDVGKSIREQRKVDPK